MAEETTTTTLTELVYGEWISPILQSYARNYRNPTQFFAAYQPTNGSATVSVPRWVSDQGTASDDGAGVDTEYNATEATDLANEDLETLDSTFAISEYGIMRTVTDTVLESAVNAGEILGFIAQDASSILGSAAIDDACALFASLSNTSGSTGVNCSVANVDDALYALATRGALGDLVGIFDNQAMLDFLNDLQSVGTSWAVYPVSAGAMMQVNAPNLAQARPVEGLVFSYKGMDCYRNGHTDTANTAADVVSAIFVRGDIEANRPLAAFGQAYARQFRVETQRDASMRATEVVSTMRWGCGELIDGSGQRLVTDA
jgi:hypothetical protein